jgi:hypothetical protein
MGNRVLGRTVIINTLTVDITPVIGGPKPIGFNAHFVDSVNGSDANDGATPVTAFGTLARAAQETLTASSYVLLARGSRFLEELTGWPGGVHVLAYGSGARPIIDGRDIAVNASFSKTVGQTNVYQIAWSHGFAADGGKSAHRVWEAGTMMPRAASIAACDATPGSFYAAEPTTSGPDTVYVHPEGSTNPATNGREYALTKRRWCVQLYTSYKQANVTGLETIGNSYADGSLVIDGYVEDCVARDGRIHNAFILGEAVNCQALGCETGINSAMYVSYMDVGFGGPSNRNVLYRNCLADALSTVDQVDGFLVHTDGVRWFGTVEYRDCRSVGTSGGWNGVQAQKFVSYRCTYDNVINANGFYGTQGNFILGGTGRTRGGPVEGGLLYVNTVAPDLDYVIHGCKVLNTSGFGPVFFYAPFATALFERCTMVTDIGGSIKFMRGDVTMRKCVSAYGNILNTQLHYFTDPIDAYDVDYNCYWYPVSLDAFFQVLYPTPVYITSLVDWRAYLTGASLGAGKDANSIAQDPLIAGLATLDFTIGNPAVLALGAGAEPDEEDDPVLQAYWLANRVTEV